MTYGEFLLSSYPRPNEKAVNEFNSITGRLGQKLWSICDCLIGEEGSASMATIDPTYDTSRIIRKTLSEINEIKSHAKRLYISRLGEPS